MPTQQDVKFSDYIRGLPAASESDLFSGNNFPFVTPDSLKKMGGENVAKASVVGLFESEEDFSGITEYNRGMSATSWYYQGGHKSLKLNKGWKYVVECLEDSEDNGAFSILNDSFVDGNNLSGTIPFSENYPSRIVLNKGTSFTLEANDDDAYLVVLSRNAVDKSLLYKVVISGGSVNSVYERTKNMVADLSDRVGDYRTDDLSGVTEYDCAVSSAGGWYKPSKHKAIKIVKGVTFKITSSSNNTDNGIFAILNSSFVDGDNLSGAVPFSENYPSRIIVAVGESFEFTAAEDDAYICFTTRNAVDVDLSYSVDVLSGELKKLYNDNASLTSDLAEYVGKIDELEDFSTIVEYSRIVGGGASWYNGGKHKSFKLNKGRKYIVECLKDSEDNGAISILNGTFVDGNTLSGAVPFSENYPSRIVLSKGSSFTIEAKDDDAYLVVNTVNAAGSLSRYNCKIAYGALKDLQDEISVDDVKIKILEYNVGGFLNGTGFVDPSMDVCKDLHKFISDISPDIFVPCEVINSQENYYKTIRTLFTQVNPNPSGFKAYSATSNLNISNVQYKTLYCYKNVETKESWRNSLMASFVLNGCKIGLVPWHGQTLNGTWAGLTWEQVKANLDDWFSQIEEDDYDVILICGDTNIYWNYDSSVGLVNNFNIVKYFVDKGYCYVNGGNGNTAQNVDLGFCENFAESTFVNESGRIPGTEGHTINIDNLVMKSVSGKFDVSAKFKVFSDSYMNEKYPALRGATYPDHIPIAFDLTISKK